MARGGLDTNLVAVVERELGRMTTVAIMLTGSRHDADDLVQDTLAKVVREWTKVQQARTPSAYVRSMMMNEFISGKRRRSSTEVVSTPTVEIEGDKPQDPTQAYIQRHDLLQHLDKLPARQRAVVVLRFLEDASVGDVAEALQMSQSAVRVMTIAPSPPCARRCPRLCWSTDPSQQNKKAAVHPSGRTAAFTCASATSAERWWRIHPPREHPEVRPVTAWPIS